MKALVSIDYTNDFVDTEGALTTGSVGQAIESALVDLTETFIRNNDFVVFAMDAHQADDEYHPENRLFPPHNIIGSQGQRPYGTVDKLYQHYQSQANVYWINKRHYSAFCGTDLDLRLRERQINEVHLIGVCTDICVLHTAIDAYNLGYAIVIHADAVASFDLDGHKWALNHFKNVLGAAVV